MKLWLKYLIPIILIATVSFTVYIPSQSDFALIIIPYCLAFGAYYTLVFTGYFNFSFTTLLGLAILCRLILIFPFPNLSDDVYRFIWDGRCMHLGISPFRYLPSDIVGQYEGLDQALYQQLNSPNYYSIYPPLGQLVSYIATFPIWTSYYASAVIMKTIMAATEIGSIFIGTRILKKLNLPRNNIFIYALNPLILIELVGNIHHEVFMVFFLLLFIQFILKGNHIKSGISTGMAIISKILPVMFAPLILVHLRDIKKILLVGISAISLILISFSLLLDFSILKNLFESIGLYVDKFEFNASIYYLIRWIGYQVKGFNIIHIAGPVLSILTITAICLLAYIYNSKERLKKELISYMLFSFTVYLVLATIVHPWYLSVLLALCVFTKFRYPVVWSLLIIGTYANYSGGEYVEQLWIVVIEYLVVFGVIIYECFIQRKVESVRH